MLTCSNRTWNVDTDSLCTNCRRCNLSIPGGWIDPYGCYDDTNCIYRCDFMYVKNSNISRLKCSDTNEWVPSTPSAEFSSVNDLCIPKLCSSEIPNGHLLYSNSCSTPNVGYVCGVQCDIGYNGNVSNITCQSSQYLNGEVEIYWSMNGTHISPHSLCFNSKQCAFDVIPHGSLDTSCTRNPGDACSYACEKGYRSTDQSTQNIITCTSSSTWNKPLSSLCERIRCPETISNGRVYSSCSRYIYTFCNSYYCNSGFQRSHDSNYLKCNASGEWEWDQYSTVKFCLSEEELCPSDIKNGWVANYCRRTEGSLCRYYCNTGCKYSYSVYYMTCKNKTWGRDTDILCSDCQSTTPTTTHRLTQCPSFIPNGYVSSSCSRHIYSSCDYYCDSGCSNYLSAIQCSAYGEWYDADTACYCSGPNVRCPYFIPNGYIDGSCDYTPGSSCSVSCYSGCDAVHSTTHCDRNGHWDKPCDCGDTTTTEDSGSGHIGAFSIIGIILAICFLFCMIGGCWIYNKRLSSNSDNQSANGQSISRRTARNINNHADQIGLSQYQAAVASQQITNNDLTQGPPAYSEVAFVKSEPIEQPPSYDEVTAHPLSFNTDHRSTSLW